MHRVSTRAIDPWDNTFVGRGGKFGGFALSSHPEKESLRDDSLERPGAKAAPRVYKLILRWIKTRNTFERKIHLTFAPASQDKLLFERRGRDAFLKRHCSKFGGDRVPLRKTWRTSLENPLFWLRWLVDAERNCQPWPNNECGRGYGRGCGITPKIHRGRISQRRLQYASETVSYMSPSSLCVSAVLSISAPENFVLPNMVHLYHV